MIAQILNGGAFESSKFSKSVGHPLIRIRDVGNDITDCCYDGDFDSSYEVNKGDLVVGMDGDFKSARWKGSRALLNQRVCKITVDPNLYAPTFLDIALPAYLNAINERTSSVTVKHLSSKSIAEIPLPLPPLEEQHRIVAKVAELFTRLDAGVNGLKAVKAQLKLYRQSVLKSAFEGKLTAEWRKAHKRELEPAGKLLERIRAERKEKLGRKFKEPSPIDTSALPELPDGWVWVRLNQVADMCLGKMLDKVKNKGEYEPYLRNINVRWGAFDLTDLAQMRFEKEEEEKYGLQIADLVVCEGGEPGRAAVWKHAGLRMKIQKALHKVRFQAATTHAEYVSNYLRLSAHNGSLSKYFTGTTIKHLTGVKLAEFVFPLPSKEEQHEIVAEIERCFSVADAIEKVVEQSLGQSERLRQSILKRAFEGKLLPQDPNDPPASELLERIRSEREKATRESEERNKKRTTAGR